MKELNLITAKLTECLPRPEGRIFLLANATGNFTSVVCFLLVGDKFDTIESLKNEVEECVKSFNVSINLIGNKGAITITPN